MAKYLTDGLRKCQTHVFILTTDLIITHFIFEISKIFFRNIIININLNISQLETYELFVLNAPRRWYEFDTPFGNS